MMYTEVEIACKSFFESLREHAMEIINFKKKKMIINRLLNDYSVINRTAAEICYLCNEQIKDKHAKDKKYHKVRDHCHNAGLYKGAAHSICNLKYIVPKKIPIAFYNGSNYDYPFIIKELAEKF